jgi:hypothetical protein
VIAGESGWTITFPPGPIVQRTSRGLFGRVQRRAAVLCVDEHVYYLAWERLPDGYLEQRGVAQILRDAFDPIRHPDENIKSLDWCGYPALRLDVSADLACGSLVQIIGLAVVADHRRVVAITLPRRFASDPQAMETFVKSLRR